MGDRSVNKNGGRAVARRTFLRRMVRVKKGGLIEIRSSRLKAGENAEVVVRVSPGPSDGNYDFSDLAGKLRWKGDAVAAQRRIRDEW